MNFSPIHKQFKCILQTEIYGSSLALVHFRANFHVPFSTSQIENWDAFGTGSERGRGKTFYKISKRKSSLSPLRHGGETGVGEASIPEGRETLFLYTPAHPGWPGFKLCRARLWYSLDLETLFSSVTERGCHKPAMFVPVLVSLSFWKFMVNGEHWKRRAGKHKGEWTHTSDLQRGLSVSKSTANPVPQPGGPKREA